jgi:hypothetical protein
MRGGGRAGGCCTGAAGAAESWGPEVLEGPLGSYHPATAREEQSLRLRGRRGRPRALQQQSVPAANVRTHEERGTPCARGGRTLGPCCPPTDARATQQEGALVPKVNHRPCDAWFLHYKNIGPHLHEPV